MASTYENDLRLEEMATGENSGSWGTKTNTNLELIADAFSYGTETIANADTTITIADGAADAARSLALKINSSEDLTTTRTITLAPNTTSKVWIIENNTSGGQTLTISAGSGSNVTLPNGVTKIIATDGIGAAANVTELYTNLHNITIDGVLSLADGSNSAPSLTNTGDTNTGLYFPAADEVGITTGGTQRVKVDSTGVDITGTLVSDGLTVDGTVTGNIASFINDGNSTNAKGIKIQGGTDNGFGENYKIEFFDGDGTASGRISTNTGSINIEAAPVTINEAGSDLDFRVESDGNTHALFVDAGNNRVGILDSSPSHGFTINTATAVKGGSRVNLYTATNGNYGYIQNTGASTSNVVTLAANGKVLTVDDQYDAKIFNSAGDATYNWDTSAAIFEIKRANGTFAGTDTTKIDMWHYNDTGNPTAQILVGGTTNYTGDMVFKARGGGTSGGGGAGIHEYMRLRGNERELVVNQDGLDHDFRVESDSNSNMFFVNAGDNAVGVNWGSPTEMFSVKDGNIFLYSTTSYGAAPAQLKFQYNVAAGSNPSSGYVTTVHSSQNTYSGNLLLGARGYYSSSYTDVPVLTVSAYKRVGINLDVSAGYADPSATLHVLTSGSEDPYVLVDGSSSTRDSGYKINAGGGVDIAIRSDAAGNMFFAPNAEIKVDSSSNVVINEDGANRDFRVESDTNANALFVDASANKVIVGGTSYYGGTPAIFGVNGHMDIGTTSGNAWSLAFAASQTVGSMGTITSKISGFSTMSAIQLYANNVTGGSQAASINFYTTNSATQRNTGRFINEGAFQVSNDGTYRTWSGNITGNQFINNQQSMVTLTSDATSTAFDASVIRSLCSRGGSDGYTFLTCTSGNLGDDEFRLRGDGQAYADGSWNGGGADYAEYFETTTGAAIPRGTTVVLEGNKVRAATADDPASAIIGVIRPKEDGKISAMVGNTAWARWSEKYLTDDFGVYLMEDHNVIEWEEEYLDDEGETRKKSHSYESHNIPDGITVPEDATIRTHDAHGKKFQHRQLNPDYDQTLEYVSREDRDEWVIVGLLGQVRILSGQPVGERWTKMKDISATVEEWFIR